MSADTGWPQAAYIEATVKKWENHRTPDDGEPDAVVTLGGMWVHFPGQTPVTDPAHLAYLEREYGKRNTEG